MKARCAIVLLLGLVASPALAQKVDRHGVPYRPWDVHFGGGFITMTDRDGGLAPSPVFGGGPDWDPSWAWTLDVGRYWNSHLKTEAGLAFLGRRFSATNGEIVTLPGGISGRPWVQYDVRQTQIVLAGTYQFLENTFAHPYVSAGVRVGVLDIHAERAPYIYTNTPPYTSYAIPALAWDSTEARARPYVAVGSKSYFSERTFVRPEMVLGFNDRGFSQFALRLGFGVDF